MKKNKFYLYYLRRPDKVDPFDESKGQPFYIGKGYNSRIKEHRKEAKDLLHKPGRKSYKITVIHHLWKRGLDFEEDIYLDNLSEEDAFALEVGAIEQYGRKDNGTGILANLTDGGEGSSGYIHSDEAIEKLKQIKLKENLPEETIEKMRQAKLGKKSKPETKEKQRQANLGHSVSTETKEKISTKHKGKTHTKETKEKLSQIAKDWWENNPNANKLKEQLAANSRKRKGVPRSKETKNKISETRKGIVFSPEHIKNLSESHKGQSRPHTEQTKQKLSEMFSGEKNPHFGKPPWNKGRKMTEEEKQILKEKRRKTKNDKQKKNNEK